MRLCIFAYLGLLLVVTSCRGPSVLAEGSDLQSSLDLARNEAEESTAFSRVLDSRWGRHEAGRTLSVVVFKAGQPVDLYRASPDDFASFTDDLLEIHLLAPDGTSVETTLRHKLINPGNLHKLMVE